MPADNDTGTRRQGTGKEGTRLLDKNTIKEIQQRAIPWEQLVKIEMYRAVSAGRERQNSWVCVFSLFLSVLQSESTGTEYCLLLLLETMMSFSSVLVLLTFPKIKSLTSITEVFASTAKADKKSFASRYVKIDFPPGTPEYTDLKQ